MDFAGQNVKHTWQPANPRPMKYILVPLAMLVPVVLISAGFVAALEFAAFKSNGDARTANPQS
jgi:hypothetical protein